MRPVPGAGTAIVTNVLDAENSRLLLMVEGRSSEALGAFAKALREHGGDPSQIKAIAMDMSPAYVKGAEPTTFPRPGSFLISSTLWCWPAKHWMRCAASLRVRARDQSQRCALELARQRLEPHSRASRAT